MVASAVPIAIGAAVLSAGVAGFTAINSAQQMKAQAAEAKLNAKIADTRAMQVDAERRAELDRALGAIGASRAGSNLGALTPTAMAFVEEATQNISATRLREIANERQRAANFRVQAKSLKSAARLSLITGGIKAGLSLAQGFSAASSLSAGTYTQSVDPHGPNFSGFLT